MQAYTVTRWNSQLKMLRLILSIPPEKLEEIDKAPTLSTHKRKLINDIIEILGPFEEATDFAQTELVPSAGYVVPCVRGLKHEMERLLRKYNSSFVRNLKSSLEIRLLPFETNECYQLAPVLDPRFKLRWCTDDAEKENMKCLLKEKVTMLIPNTRTPTVEKDNEVEQPAKRRRVDTQCSRLFTFMQTTTTPQAPSVESLEEEISTYLSSPCEEVDINPLNFWKENSEKYQKLTPLVKKVLSVPSSSAAVERLFSTAGKVFTPERCRLNDSRFSKLMFIRCNNFFNYF